MRKTEKGEEIMGIGAFAAFCGIVLAASFIQGVSGFAFSMIVLMVFPYLFGYTKSLVLAAMMATFVMLYNAFLYRRTIDWTWVVRWLAVYIVADLAGVLVLKRVGDNPIWYPLMGVIFIAMAIYLLWGQKRVQVRVGWGSMIVLSVLSGLIMGAFGVGGPLMAAFFLEATESKEYYLGTSQLVLGLTLFIDFLMRVANGMFTADLIGYTLLGVVSMVLGLYIAKRLVSRMDALTLRKFICVVMIADGIFMLLHNL